jgi:uncharacterized membrane protein
MRYEHSLVLDAPVDRVWRLTTDVERWPAFMPTVRAVKRLDDGPIRVGSTARVKQPAQPPAVWRVTRLADGSEFTWETTRMGLRMIGSHRLEPTADGTRNTLALEVTGRGAGLFAAIFGVVFRWVLSRENAAFQRAAPLGTQRVAPTD